jgi:hypothetical protein
MNLKNGEWYTVDGEFVGYECLDCSRAVTDWSAEDTLWAKVMGRYDAGHICCDCFIMRAHRMDVFTRLVEQVLPEQLDHPTDLQPPAPSESVGEQPGSLDQSQANSSYVLPDLGTDPQSVWQDPWGPVPGKLTDDAA